MSIIVRYVFAVIGLTPTTTTRLVAGHSCSSPREATTGPTPTTTTTSTPVMDTRVRESEYITQKRPDTSSIDISNGVTQSSSGEWLILAVGVASCALFILVITLTTTVLCVVRCLQTKHEYGK